MVRQGEVVPVQVEGDKVLRNALGSDLPLLESLEAGKIPATSKPLGTTTLDAAIFLASVDIVSARGRAGWLLDFEYVWEVYKPAA